MRKDWIDCDTSEVVVDRLMWHPGSPFDPPGYYVFLKFKGRCIAQFLDYQKTKPEELE